MKPSSSRYNKRLELLACVIALSLQCSGSSGFSISSSVLSSTHGQQVASQLWANAASKRSKKSNNKSDSSSPAAPAGGFGSVVNTKPKIRTVSGRTGSGTKPLRAAANAFDRLRKEFNGAECSADVYCRNPLDKDPQRLWFVGKVAVDTSTPFTTEHAALAQKRLILEYAKRELRPQNLAVPALAPLELWLAPGDSEMDAVQNKIALTKVVPSELPDDFDVSYVGYNPEIYVGDERVDGGLRIWRDDKGNPVKAPFEVNNSL